MAQPTVHITATAVDGTDTVEMGIIVPSNPRRTTIRIVLRNYSDREASLAFSLSNDLAHLFTITKVSATDDSIESTPGDVSVGVWNQNLLYSQTTDSPNFFLLPLKEQHLLLHLAPVTRSNSTSHSYSSKLPPLAGSSPLKRTLNGRLHITSGSSKNVLTSLLLLGLICDSSIRPEVDVLQIGQSVVGEWSYEELVINNLADVPTTICLSSETFATNRSSNDSSKLVFFDISSGKQTVPPIFRIDRLGAVRIKIGARPTNEKGNQFWLAVQNLLNPLDVWYIRVVAKVMSQQDALGVFLSCGSQINFGDCYAHCRKSQDIVVRNDYSETIKLSMRSDRKDQITFEILPEGLDGEAFHVDTHVEDRKYSTRRSGFLEMKSLQTSEGMLQNDPSEFDENKSDQPTPLEDPASNLFVGMQYENSHKHVAGAHNLKNRTTAGLTESLQLFPGQQKGIRVWYLPLRRSWEQELRPSRQEMLSKLRPQQCHLFFKISSGESIMVTCHSKVCESMVRLQRSGVHMGDCNVMVKYNSEVTIINYSDLKAHLSVSYVSQCVVAAAHEVFIEPSSTYELKLDFVPRQVNPDYHKEITFTNLSNPNAEELVFTLRANCIDRQGVSLHALFYKILAPNPTNEIDFGRTVANHPAIKSFVVRNISQQRLVLELQGCAGVTTYLLSPEVDYTERSKRESRRYDKLEKYLTRAIPYYCTFCDDDIADESDDWEPEPYIISTKALIDLEADYALFNRDFCKSACNAKGNGSGQEKKARETSGKHANDWDPNSWEGENDNGLRFRGEDNWEHFIACARNDNLSILSSTSTSFATQKSEVNYSEDQFRPLRRLRGALVDGYLEEKQVLTVEPGADSLVIVSLTMTDGEMHESTKMRTFEKFLAVRMLEYDMNRLDDLVAMGGSKQLNQAARRLFQSEGRCFRPRQIVLNVQACKSRMEIAPLRQLNFGTIQAGAQKDKAFTIVNLSEAPLLYELRKVGEDYCNELRLNVGKGRCGVVRPYFTKVVPFIFAPASEGVFQERIVIENRLDSTADCELVIKATISQ